MKRTTYAMVAVEVWNGYHNIRSDCRDMLIMTQVTTSGIKPMIEVTELFKYQWSRRGSRTNALLCLHITLDAKFKTV